MIDLSQESLKKILHYNSSTGVFDDKEQAARAYNKKAVELFGEFAHLNEVL